MVLPPITEKKFTEGYPKMKICVTGAGGFIASHLARRLKAEGHWVRAIDWKENEHMTEDMFCDEFMLLDLRWPENCHKAVAGCEWCFNLAVRGLCSPSSPPTSSCIACHHAHTHALASPDPPRPSVRACLWDVARQSALEVQARKPLSLARNPKSSLRRLRLAG